MGRVLRRGRLALVFIAAMLVAAACAEEAGGDAAASTGAGDAVASGPTGAKPTGPTGGGGGTTGGYGGGGGRYDYGTDDDGGDDGHSDGGDVALTADNFAFAPTSLSVPSGTEIAVENANAGTPHTFTVEGTDIDLELSPGDVEDVTIDLDPGNYAFACRFHAAMTGTLTVT